MSEYNDSHLYSGGSGDAEPDDLIDIDVSDIGDDTPVPDGEYVLEVYDVRLKREDGRLKNIFVTFRIAEGDYAGREVIDVLNFGNEFGRKIAYRFFRRMGCLVEKDGRKRLQARKEDLVGKRVGAYLEQETYKGDTRSRPRRYMDPAEVGKSEAPKL